MYFSRHGISAMDMIAISRVSFIVYATLTVSATITAAMDTSAEYCERNALLKQHINVCAPNSGQRIDLNVYQIETADANVNFTICTGKYSELFEWSKSEEQLSLKNDVRRSKEGEFYVKIVISSDNETQRIFSVILVSVNVSEVYCESNWQLQPVPSQYCTVVIALLASICLILLTAFALTFIVLKKNRLSILSSKQPFDNESAPNVRNNGFITPRKPSNYDLQSSPNGRTNHRIDSVIGNQSFPRKSSLKATRVWDNDETERDGGHSNGAFTGDDDSTENKKSDESPDFSQEPRRKSVVTFNDTTQVIQIAAKCEKK